MLDAAQMPPAEKKVHGVQDKITIEGEGPAQDRPAGFRFGRMFPAANYHALILKLDTCLAVGERMTALTEQARADTAIPAGFTYFGQFVDHDISFDVTETERDDPNTPHVEATPLGELMQDRSPSLDLDSLYGRAFGRREDLFDGAKFKIGLTSGGPGDGNSDKVLPYDLPRSSETAPGKQARKASIGDPRNDENLAVAQTHLLFLKFHNAVVDQLRQNDPTSSRGVLFETARDLVTKHYQWIVLHDFVKRYIDEDVFKTVIEDGKRKYLCHGPGEIAFMPLEFSVAAYRFGHSQVREEYDWNVNFGPGGSLATSPFSQLFEFSEVSGNFRGFAPTLPTNWVADYRRLYDFDGMSLPHLSGASTGTLNLTKAIDPFLASALGKLPEIEMIINDPTRPPQSKPPFSNLAALNIRRGSMRGLPAGQDISRMMSDVKMLTKAEMKGVIDDEFDTVMEANGLYERTPLWLYLLLEAAARHNGQRMGPMGSIITAETFLTLVLTSRTSILKPGAEWTPADARATLDAASPIETMVDLIKWIDDREPIINPLEDDRI